jgi:hypothetical protein
MPRNQDFDDSEGDPPHNPSLWMRFQTAIVKPDDPDSPKRKASEPEQSIEELEAVIARADDKERAIGLVAAPVGAVVGLILSNNLINHAKSLGESTTIYQELTYALMVLVVLILTMAWFRKRLFLGIATALLGLDLFNLHGYGFAVPFLLAGAWYLVRAWRLQAKLKLSGGGSKSTYRAPNNRLPSAGGVLPRPNKRYTPPTAKLKRPSKAKPEG